MGSGTHMDGFPTYRALTTSVRSQATDFCRAALIVEGKAGPRLNWSNASKLRCAARWHRILRGYRPPRHEPGGHDHGSYGIFYWRKSRAARLRSEPSEISFSDPRQFGDLCLKITAEMTTLTFPRRVNNHRRGCVDRAWRVEGREGTVRSPGLQGIRGRVS